MKKLSLLLALLPALALAQVQPPAGFTTGFSSFNPFGIGIAGTVVMSASLAGAGCQASPWTASPTVSLTTTRASVAYASDNSISCPAAQAVSESDGLSSWYSTTNYVLNSGTHPKTAESTDGASPLPTGTYAAWVQGSGTFTVANGTATTTGLSCTGVASGSFCAFTVTGTGTMLITTSAGVTHAQVESVVGGYTIGPSPRIDTTSAAATRAGTSNLISASVQALNLYLTNRWCATLTVKPYHAWNAGGIYSFLLFGATSTVNNANISASGTNMTAIITGSDGTSFFNSVSWATTGLTAGTAHRIGMCNNLGTPVLCVDGASVGTLTMLGTGLWAANPALSAIGSNTSGIRQVNGDVGDLKVCNGAYRCSDCL